MSSVSTHSKDAAELDAVLGRILAGEQVFAGGAPLNKNLAALIANHNAGPRRKGTIVLEGGTRSGKTWSVAEYLLQVLFQADRKIVARCVRRDSATTNETVIKSVLDVAAAGGYMAHARWFPSMKKLVFRKNKSELHFGGTLDPQKLQGMEQDILWINEAMEVTHAAYRQLAYRTRGLKIFDFNPSLSIHWIFDTILTDPRDVLHVRSTFRDNPHLTDAQVAEILATEPTPENIARGTADEYLWDVYGLGKRGRRRGAIYSNWRVVEEWPTRINCQRWGYGLDFGFSLDPTALVECCVWNDELYVREICYEPNLVIQTPQVSPGTPSLEARLKGAKIPKDQARIYADSASPRAIHELRLLGYNAIGVEKGPDSILAGINRVRERPINVLCDSLNIQRELENYSWKQAADGRYMEVPEDRNNHALDAIRYWVWSNCEPRRELGNRRQQNRATTRLDRRR